MAKWTLFIILFIKASIVYSQNEWIVNGTISDKEGNAIEHINIRVTGSNLGTSSDKNGNFTLRFNDNKNYIISFSGLNYAEKEIEIIFQQKSIKLDIILERKDQELSEVQIIDERAKEKGLIQLEPLLLDNIPNISGNQIQTFIKTLPGVASTNELSSTYSVRGGNFDENLVYINGIEVFRPMLLQSGQQEGLNMVNSDLVSKIVFSTGGFSAMYDDKMSSVLDIRYKRPTEFKASSSLSLLGATAHIEGSAYNQKFTFLTGIRYKNSQYLLNSLETQGEYKPNFFDFQTALGYKFTDRLNINLLAYYANNNYLFFPEDRTTSFGTTNEALNLYVDFEGNEKDKFTSLMSGIAIEYRPLEKMSLKLAGSSYSNREALTYDIEGRYSLNQLDKELGSSTFGDSILNLGIGQFIEHARSYLDAFITNINHTGWLQTGNNFIQWGAKYQIEQVQDQVNEWKMIDSAGYAIPQNTDNLELAEFWHSKNNLNSNRITSFFQVNYKANSKFLWNIEYGVRASWWDVNKQWLISPRASIGFYPEKSHKLYMRFGSGLYYQSVFYREMIDKQGNMNTSIKTPYSIQYTASGDYDFNMLSRPFHFKAELYYKNLKQIIPYSIDNIRINYYPDKKGEGYAGGLDLRLNGEFVEGTDSWLSVSLMKSGIRINGDTLGIQPLPNDHLINISLFFQDYIPGNKRFKMYLALFYLSGLPFGPPNNKTYYAPLKMPAYKRVDIGFSMILKQDSKHYQSSFVNAFNKVILNIEVFNLLGIYNTVSYSWVTVVPNSSIVGNDNYASFAVPNHLSARRVQSEINDVVLNKIPNRNYNN